MNALLVIIWLIIGYVIGSIPWSLVIGKVFFNTDIREHGSGNLGGTNAGRVLGKKVGAIVVVLDALKAFIVMIFCNRMFPPASAYAGLAVCVGHCFPVFANFRGGKAVACSYGYLLGVGLFITGDPVFSFVFPVLIFFLVLGISKMVSLSSIVALVCETLIGFLTYKNIPVSIMVLMLTLFVIYRHQENIKRIIKGTESKIKWLK